MAALVFLATALLHISGTFGFQYEDVDRLRLEKYGWLHYALQESSGSAERPHDYLFGRIIRPDILEPRIPAEIRIEGIPLQPRHESDVDHPAIRKWNSNSMSPVFEQDTRTAHTPGAVDEETTIVPVRSSDVSVIDDTTREENEEKETPFEVEMKGAQASETLEEVKNDSASTEDTHPSSHSTVTESLPSRATGVSSSAHHRATSSTSAADASSLLTGGISTTWTGDVFASAHDRKSTSTVSSTSSTSTANTSSLSTGGIPMSSTEDVSASAHDRESTSTTSSTSTADASSLSTGGIGTTSTDVVSTSAHDIESTSMPDSSSLSTGSISTTSTEVVSTSAHDRESASTTDASSLQTGGISTTSTSLTHAPEEHVINMPKIRTAKIVMSSVFLAIGLIAVALMAVCIFREKRKKVKYDQLRLLP